MRRRSTRGPNESATSRGASDAGYTLVELLLVVVVLGILTSVGWLAVTGMSTEAADTGCGADERVLYAAVQLYLADHDEIPATGADRDRYERTLVAADLIRSASGLHDVAAHGTIVPEGPTC